MKVYGVFDTFWFNKTLVALFLNVEDAEKYADDEEFLEVQELELK